MANLTSDRPSMKPSSEGMRVQKTNVGSGSRPTPSKIKIPTSAATNAHTLDRESPGGNDALK